MPQRSDVRRERRRGRAGKSMAEKSKARAGRGATEGSARAAEAVPAEAELRRHVRAAARRTSTREDGHRFVVQRHRAPRLHYDLRLEAGGVLLSWAVPKGPTLDPDAKRMAVHVEDHPLDYFDFEGVIPGGEYGGGDVIVWDWGTWPSPTARTRSTRPRQATSTSTSYGEKLRGHFALVRRGERGGKEQWLLIHKHDEYAVPGWDAEDHPRSVKTGRTNDEVRRRRRRHGRVLRTGRHRPPTNSPRSTRSGKKVPGSSAATPCS